jgi:hypothetical protein
MVFLIAGIDKLGFKEAGSDDSDHWSAAVGALISII